MRALNDIGLLNRIGVISAVSGGAVIGAYYAYTPGKSFEEFEKDVREILQSGFQWEIARELLRPSNLIQCIGSTTVTLTGELLAAIAHKNPEVVRKFSRTELFRQVLDRLLFQGLTTASPRRNGIEIVIGASELRTGTAFRFGNMVSGSWRKGRLRDTTVDIALAVTASAAYPIFLPAMDRTWRFEKDGIEAEHRVLLTDGGVYDNLGTQVLEPGRNPLISLHSFPCDYLIVCNAGQGQESVGSLPLSALPRIKRAFGVIHRRVQDSAMSHLHELRRTGEIKGFVMPYLGQLDEKLTWKPSGLLPRSQVISYPTDFAEMNKEWINRLSMRGEQLTRHLVARYIPELI